MVLAWIGFGVGDAFVFWVWALVVVWPLSCCFCVLVCRACLWGFGFGVAVCLFCWISCCFVLYFGMVVMVGWLVMVVVDL